METRQKFAYDIYGIRERLNALKATFNSDPEACSLILRELADLSRDGL